MEKFEIGKTYSARCFGDHNLVCDYEVIARTAKTITVNEKYDGIRKVKVRINESGEYASVASGFSFLRA